MATDELYMVRLGLDASHLARLGHRAKLPPTQEDLGYLVHMALAGLFGGGTVRPFRVHENGRGRNVAVLGYTDRSQAKLVEHADTFADPGVHQACRWDELAVKPMPHDWPTGRRLGFEVRVCPVVRLSSAVETTSKGGEAVTYEKGREVDAWLHRCWLRTPSKVGREEVYGEWLAERIGEAAQVSRVALHAFRRIRLVRRDQSEKRKAHVAERPDALLRGELAIRDGDAFQAVLANGVGRHRAFGFGMLLLRPPG